MRYFGIFWFFIGAIFVPAMTLAQDEAKNVVSMDDGYTDYFFDALKEKSIENYDKAIEILQKCKEIQPENPVTYFELGKNYLAQKKYLEAYDNFEKTAQMDPKYRWAWVGMYDVCYETRDYNRAIPIVEKLIQFKEDYKEDLTSLYMNTKQYDKALVLINELNEKFGKSEKRELYKAEILKDSKYQSVEKNDLLEQIKRHPKEESNYLSLIYLYSQSNQEEKALEIAQKLAKEIPTSEWAQVSLFKFHLNNMDGDNAVKAMNIVLKSDKIDLKIKHRVFNEFLIFTNDNPKYEPDLDKAINYLGNDKNVNVMQELGKFYYSKTLWVKAIKYFEMYLKGENGDVETNVLLLQAYLENNQWTDLSNRATTLSEVFPTQPQFYYYVGLAKNQLKEFKKAIDFLKSGLEFVIEDVSLEINFNIQLGEAYNGLGNDKEKERYFIKANELLKNKK